MNDFLRNVRVPGILWAVLIIVIVALAHDNEAYLLTLGIRPFYIDLGIGLLIGILKKLDIDHLQLDKALDIIESILHQQPPVPPGPGQRAAVMQRAEKMILDVPKRPNKAARWLVG